MSIQSEIDRIKNNVTGTYSAISEMGGTIPSEQNSNNLAGAVKSIPQGTQFSVDDTLEMSEDNVLSVTTPVKSVLTQEEFDALSEEEKSSGLYIIAGEGEEGNLTGGVTIEEVNETIDNAIQNTIGDINAILDSINGEVV